MKQQYYLKKMGVGLIEQSYMTAEERAWWFKKHQEEQEELERTLKGTRQL